MVPPAPVLATRAPAAVAMVAALLGSCVTNPVTRENFRRDDRPLGWSEGLVISALPGVGQFVSGETAEGVIYLSGIAAATVAYFIFARQGQADAALLSAAAGWSLYAWQYFDGGWSISMRRQQWQSVGEELGVLPRPAPPARKADTTRLRIGMTDDDAIEAIGRPQDINRTVTAAGTDEQWVYSGAAWLGDEVYVYFENGILTSWQE